MKRHLTYIFISIVYSFGLLAQQDIPALKKKLINQQNDSIRLYTYSLLAKNYRSIDKKISREYIDSVQKFVSNYEKINKKLKDYHLLYKANSLTTLANIAFEANDLDESIKINLECAKIYEKLNYPSLLSVSLSNAGAIFTLLGKYDDAIRYLLKSINLESESLMNDPDNVDLQISVAEGYINLGGVCAKTNRVDSSINYFEQALSLYSKSDNLDGIASSYNGLVNGYRFKKQFDKALDYAKNALLMFKKINSPKEVSYSYVCFSDIYLDMKNYPKALQYADSVENLCKEIKFFDNLLYTYETKTLIYEGMNDLKNQIRYLKKYNNLKDSLQSVNNNLQIEELKTQYETERKEREIVALSKDNEIKGLQVEKDAATKTRLMVIILSITVVVFLLIWLAVSLSKTIKERKAAYIKLQEKNIEIQKQGEQLSEQSKLISKYQSQMNPHFIFNALNSIQGSVLNDNKDKTIDRLQLLSQLMRQTLNNSENDHITLETEVKYLNTYVDFEKQKFVNGLIFEVSYPKDHEDILIPPMMIQPFIENAIKHACLQSIKNACIVLAISIENNLLKIFIKDNGVGFDANDVSFLKNSHALKIIQSRLQLLFMTENKSNQINFEIKSKPLLENGTEIKFYLPLNYKY